TTAGAPAGPATTGHPCTVRGRQPMELDVSSRPFALIPAYRVCCRHDPLDARSRQASRLPQLLIARRAGKLPGLCGGVRMPLQASPQCSEHGFTGAFVPGTRTATLIEATRLTALRFGAAGRQIALRSR